MKNKIPKPNTKNIIIKKSKIHNNGVFARKNIRKGTKVIEYVGEVVSTKEGDKRAEEQDKLSKKDPSFGKTYVFELNNKFDLDGNFKYNPARFINHSCNPNCKYKQEKLRIWIVARKNIKEGEEISYDYGYDLEDYKDPKCKCGSKKCIGYIIGKSYRKDFKKLVKKSK
jgi:uncharacterized protein